MKGKHFEIGTIQAFLDGETTPEVSLRLTDHVAGCDACAKLLATAEEESSLVFSALDRELNSLVPTQRLWTRINESIAVEQSHTTFWQRVLLYIRTSLTNPSLAAAAGVVIVAGMFAILWMPRTGDVVVQVPQNRPHTTSVTADPPSATTVASSETPASVSSPSESTPATKYVSESKFSPAKIREMVQPAVERRPVQVPNMEYASSEYLPGEESYVKTISDLKQNVDSQKDAVLTPSSRVSYERDMAVVNDSISRMREVVRRNPRNQAARQVLYSSYQDKIDLMNSVAQREEMMARLK
jgi:hypothetical protein